MAQNNAQTLTTSMEKKRSVSVEAEVARKDEVRVLGIKEYEQAAQSKFPSNLFD